LVSHQLIVLLNDHKSQPPHCRFDTDELPNHRQFQKSHSCWASTLCTSGPYPVNGGLAMYRWHGAGAMAATERFHKAGP
jgi:hypothetical protein